MKFNYCHRRPTIVVKTKHEAVNFDMYLCNAHSKEEIVYLNSKFKSKVQVGISSVRFRKIYRTSPHMYLWRE